MKKSKPEHRIAYWKFHVAAYAFQQAEDVAIKLKSISNKDVMYQYLMVALHVLYARPFKHQKNSRKIPESYIPKDLLSVHETLLNMRDRVFAHHDKNSKLKDSDTDIDLFQLVLEVKGGEMRPGVQMIFPTNYQLEKIQSLCKHLHKKCTLKAEEILSKCLNEVPNDGMYRITTDFQNSTPLLIRSEISTELISWTFERDEEKTKIKSEPEGGAYAKLFAILTFQRMHPHTSPQPLRDAHP
ncbi:hypothetical protein P4E94_19310 [Pontiellaceae bacterium B12219]|nr:hypothetical protein [Pontiellaceae bacterium B12219]